MQVKNFTFIVTCSLMIFMAGCATVDSLERTRQEFPDRIKSCVFSYSYDKVYTAAKDVCKDLKLTIYSQDEKKGSIYVKSSWRWAAVIISTGMMGFGEKALIQVTTVDANSTKVEVAVQKTYMLDVGHVDWREKVLKSIEEHLKSS